MKPLITSNPSIRFGKPCIAGTRISVDDIKEAVASGMSQESILAAFPQLKPEHIQAAIDYASKHYISLPFDTLVDMKLIGRCKDCKYRDHEKNCKNNHFEQGDAYAWGKSPDLAQSIEKAGLVFEYDEGGAFRVGDNFGCIHWEAKPDPTLP